ncbi:uncharacterized protein BJ171DRAFT_523313 [Polychytrium aggregatum]|uniref:uncharacterized protein n=1 Tax=Polychytrium aggregatum TaxID=110093 RepID=UPI0022FEB0F6|nr:uncharacterized protein BJ171DRAFT_544418 [Polychytrium aggregatum]XP_052962752.1 uncharacterized protein BJ171DRAFT_523313 [Polychytrium aggregatum]KAI9190553.1 hypothetical protein BJ171DRAFT_544418 [Polychytrium aggregatum]KAI9197095.1 hypothetical protein BJ171DRAFT_523313 [Polychytrium aggregatum]
MSSITKTTRAAPAAAPRARKRRATAPTLVQPEPVPEPVNAPSTSDRPVATEALVAPRSRNSRDATPALLESLNDSTPYDPPVEESSASDAPVDTDDLATLSHEIDTASLALPDADAVDQVQQPATKVKRLRRQAVPKPAGAVIFRGHPLLEPYPQTNADGTVNPIIVLDSSQRQIQRTQLGPLHKVTIGKDQIFCDAREAIALSDDRKFEAYDRSRDSEDDISTRNSIKKKWGDSLHFVRAVYVKFDGDRAIYPFVDDRGLMQIISRGKGVRCRKLRETHNEDLIKVYGRDMRMLAQLQARFDLQDQRDDVSQNEDAIFLTGVKSRE